MHHILSCRTAAAGILVFCAASVPCDNVHAQQRDAEHVLFQAIRRGDATLLRGLLRRGTPPDVRDDDGTTPLMSAALHGTAEMVALLLEYDADPTATNERGVTALLWGAQDAEKVRLLLARSADPNSSSELGNTPLIVAAAAPDSADAVARLLAHGAEITAKNRRGRTALQAAAGGGDVETVRLLLARARDLDRLDDVIDDAGSVVATAAHGGFHDIVKLLLENGADPNRSSGSRGHGLNRALLAGHTEIAATLIGEGVRLIVRSRPDDTPTAVLAAYTEQDDTSIAELLQERGVDFTAANGKQQTALTWARLRGHQQLIDALTKAGVPEGELPERPEIPVRPVDSQSDNYAQLIVQAVQKSVDLLQHSSDTFLDERSNCVSCHHQNLPAVAIAWARDRGFHIRQASLDRIVQRQLKSWAPRENRVYELDSPFPVAPRFLGWGMWTFAERFFAEFSGWKRAAV